MNPQLPLYAQLKEAWIEAIAKGDLLPGDRLPTQRALAQQYHASHMTVRRAINELIHEGVIYAIAGKGIYVAEQKQDAETEPLMGFTEYMAHRGLKASTILLDAQIISASTVMARSLEVELGANLVYLRRLRLADGLPVGIQTAYLPHELCPGLLDHDLERNSLFATLRNVYHLRLTDYSFGIGAKPPDEEQVRLLGIHEPSATAVLVAEQLTFLDDGAPIEFVRSVYRGDRYRLRLAGNNLNRSRN